jgi:hypothetical protein
MPEVSIPGFKIISDESGPANEKADRFFTIKPKESIISNPIVFTVMGIDQIEYLASLLDGKDNLKFFINEEEIDHAAFTSKLKENSDINSIFMSATLISMEYSAKGFTINVKPESIEVRIIEPKIWIEIERFARNLRIWHSS